MGIFKAAKNFVDEQFTPSDHITEPERSKMQFWMNIAKRAGGAMVGGTVALFVADPILTATHHPEVASTLNDVYELGLGGSMLVFLGCVAKIGVLENNAGHREQDVV